MSRLVQRTLTALKDSSIRSSISTLVLSIKKPNQDITSGRMLKQLDTHIEPNIVYELRNTVEFRKSDILWSVEIDCKQDREKNRIIIPREVLQEKLNVLKSDEQSEQQIWHDSEQQNEVKQPRPQHTPSPRRRKGRPKGSKNKKKYPMRSDSESEDKDCHHSQVTPRRGKGRPKGSKNKKSLLDSHSLSGMKNNLSKRWQYGDYQTPKSKMITPTKKQIKIQHYQIQIGQFNQQKRGKGRPKGTKNRPKSEDDNNQQQISQQQQQFDLPLQIDTSIQSQPCCSRCSNRSFKQSLIKEPLSVQKNVLLASSSNYSNLWFDLSSQNRSNIVIESIKNNIDAASFQILLSKLKQYDPYFTCCWQYKNRIEDLSYIVKTNKNNLSQTGKQGNYALLHDCFLSTEVWWKQIGVQRLLEAMTIDTDKNILDILKKVDEKLKKQIEDNVPDLIRSGNYEIAKHLIAPLVVEKEYSKEHLQCLEQKIQTTNFKKASILKQNFGNNFCSPVHCMAVNPNPYFLKSIFKSSQDYNVNDSLMRKPIHYAAVAKTPANMQVLLQNKFDLKQADRNRVTPLMLAAMYGKCQNLLFILQKVPDALYINFRCKQGLSALHYAVIYQQIQCVKILLRNNFVDVQLQARDKLTPLHLAAGNGNILIVKQLLRYKHSVQKQDRYKRTPLFFAIRNNNHLAAYELLKQGAKYYKKDSSSNSLLHYCAAYGNTLFLQHFLPHLKQNKNKQKYYPWQIAVGKGHIGCMKLLGKQENNMIDGAPQHHMAFLNMKHIRYTAESMQIMKELIDNYCSAYDVDSNGSRLLHCLCSIGEKDYVKARSDETGKKDKQSKMLFKKQYKLMQNQLVQKLQSKGSSALMENKKLETPISLCLQRQNIEGLKLLLKGNMNLQVENANGQTLLHYFSHLASQGLEGVKFVLQRLQLPKQDKKHQQRNKLRDALKRTDSNGFEAILFFVKDFTFKVKSNFAKRIKILRQSGGVQASNAEGIAFQQYVEHQKYFIKLISLMVELGCDANVFVQQRKRPDQGQSYRKWGILHFLMKFPSKVLLQFFKTKIKIRDYNVQNNSGMTPLHLFCQWIRFGSLFQLELGIQHDNYRGQRSLKFLLQNGCTPQSYDVNRSTPILYAALNRQIQFMVLLRRFGAQFNECNNCNQVPFIEIIKMKAHFTYLQIQKLLQIGCDPNCQDLNKQTALHHLVNKSTNFDNSVELCKLFFEYCVEINSLDKYERTPLFYCFAKIDGDDAAEPQHDRIQILQILLKQPKILINHRDVFKRTPLHYACQKNFFFSILYLLDKKIDTNTKDYEGNTPLAVCLKNKTLNQAAMLIKKGVTQGYVAEGQQSKVSYFSYAVSKLSLSVCFMLLDHGYPIQKAIQQVPNQQIKSLLETKYSKFLKPIKK